MRYKFALALANRPEYFDWQQLPQDWDRIKKGERGDLPGDENLNLQNLIDAQKGASKSLMKREEARR